MSIVSIYSYTKGSDFYYYYIPSEVGPKVKNENLPEASTSSVVPLGKRKLSDLGWLSR